MTELLRFDDMNASNTKFIVLRGPSGSGKSSIAREVRLAQAELMVLIGQDHFRRVVLKEKDVPNGLNAELIKRTLLFAFEHSYHVILEGIFVADRYRNMFQEILCEHPDNNFFFYLDVPFGETLRRHQFKPNKDEFGEKEMRSWYMEKDLLGFVQEVLIPATNSIEETVETLTTTCNLVKKKTT